MQHISGRKSLIGNTKSVTVLSNTGTMRFIIWGFAGTRGSGLIYLFPSPSSDLSSKLPRCQHMLSSYIWAIRLARAALADHIMTCISLHTRAGILQAMHHGSCWQHCYLAFCHLADFQVHHNLLQLLSTSLKWALFGCFFILLITLVITCSVNLVSYLTKDLNSSSIHRLLLPHLVRFRSAAVGRKLRCHRVTSARPRKLRHVV